MTDVVAAPALGTAWTWRDADALAHRAATRAGVTVRLVHQLADLTEIAALFVEIWRPADGRPPVASELMRALTHAGNYVSGAYDGDRLVGACMGFFGAPSDRVLHSHIAGVASGARGRSVGQALKLHQRAWAWKCGLAEITWTFDPLVRRNAFFNVAKLGALPREYLVDFYGDMGDAINGGQGSDRLLVAWDVTAPPRDEAGRPGGVPEGSAPLPVVTVGRGGGPVAGPLPPREPVLLVSTPEDVEALRANDPAAARAWRQAVRGALSQLLAEGAHVTGFTRTGCYVVERKRP